MGFFSRFLPHQIDVSILSEDEIARLIGFFENGWAREVRRRTGSDGPLDATFDRSIVKGLKRGWLSEEEIDYAVALLKADMDLNGESSEAYAIIRQLEWSKDMG